MRILAVSASLLRENPPGVDSWIPLAVKRSRKKQKLSPAHTGLAIRMGTRPLLGTGDKTTPPPANHSCQRP